ncbi:MAG: hypothetical protein H6607_13100 [Flavobacteriales bacterium]|nr:hypothetical protein [Flavobacteriales bacterium]
MKIVHVKFLVAFLVVTFVKTTAFSQSHKDQTTFTLNSGTSIISGLLKSLSAADSSFLDTDTLLGRTSISNFSSSSRPQIILGIDHGLSDRWSLGAIFYTGSWKGNMNYSYTDNNNVTKTGSIDYHFNRYAFALTPKIHYGKNDKVDLYSGLRVGYVLWTTNINTDHPNLKGFNGIGLNRPLLGLTAFGARFYPIENLGVNFEFNTGAPNIIGYGINYRIN